ncbi:Protein of unknown function DUF1639 [Dillenia turbinata]|uniref:DUF1639 domain-containing protein n=1 Tax=Dillenia turbinata TaxID=194707 RepID=A0AAN8Z437_9MAGN
MEKEGKGGGSRGGGERDFVLKWGNKKRLRCVKVKDKDEEEESSDANVRRKRITSRVDRRVINSSSDKNQSRNNGISNMGGEMGENRKTTSSPDKEDGRYYTTRGSSSMGLEENGGGNGKTKTLMMDDNNKGGGRDLGKAKLVWPKLLIPLSSKEKEEDFMAMKGCKLPQRPKKRAKLIQRTLLLVSPGAWLSDLCQERYEVREKKVSKKRPRGLKAMGSMESDSE